MRSIYAVITVKDKPEGEEIFVTFGKYGELTLVDSNSPANFMVIDEAEKIVERLNKHNNPTEKAFLGEYHPSGYVLKLYEIVELG